MNLQQVLTALENADRAGDTAAASELAGLARQLMGSGFEVQQPQEPSLIVPPTAPPIGGFIPGVQRGFLQTGSLLFDILPAMAARAVGADEYAEKQFAEAAETERKIQEKYAAAVPSYKDIKGVGDAITYLTESVGELVPSILPSLVTGGIAGIAGRGAVIAAKEAAEAAARKKVAEQGAEALAKKEVQDEIRQAGIDAARRTAIKYDAVGIVGGSSLQNIPEVYKNIKDETEQESLGTAILFGGFNSLLDAALPLSVLTKLRKAGIPEEQAVGAWIKRFGVGATKGFATEGATEAAQEMSSAAAEKFIDNNIEFFSEKNLERFLNAGLKGGLGGGVISGTTDVVLGKKSLTEDLKPLDEDIRNTQSDILARKAFLDELRAQADEEGRNRLNDEALKDLGLRKGPLYDSLLDKDINNPVQAEQVKLALAQAIQDPTTKPRERLAANDALNLIGEYQSAREAEPDVGQVVETAGGEGVPVPVQPAEVGAAAPGIAGVERTGVVPPVADVAEVARGEGLPPAPVEAPVEAPVPEVTPAPVSPAPAPELAVQPAPAPAEAVVPTTRELIAEQETAIAKQMEKFQGLLQEQVKRYGLKDVGVKVIDDLKNANGMYSKGLIQLAVDTADPVRALKHESVHALKELGFFTPAQWQSLVKQANTTWINTYMRNRDVDGNYLQPGQRSRYDAYIDLFKQQGLDDAAIQESLVEEAIADAFGDFAVAKEKPGMIRALINRMKNFFQSIKESVGLAGIPTSENIFGKIAGGRLEPVVKRGAADEAREPKQAIRAVQPERPGERGGREEARGLAPLEGAPSVPGFSGPDPRLVEVAERYAKDNGISLKRQSAYAEVDEEFAKRIAQAYEEMPHAPSDPAVREAYENMIRQTRAQYDALVDAGYKFWFIDLDKPSNVEYASTPWNAMRDIRANKEMGVFPTNDGFGSLEEFSPEANPLLADTGLQWPVGGPDGEPAPVLANDLFRAVHDAFGHGLEGAGFRARGEENAWQAHRRLFTGSAVGALTSETRGQNSWLNYGPYGEKNRNAKVEDTVFADQKTGLMPEWTWQEKITPDALAAPEAEPDAKFSLRGEVPLSTRAIMEANDEFARAELGLNVATKRGIANKVRDIGIALNEQTLREQGKMDRKKLNLLNETAIAKAIADEVAYQLTAGKRETGTGLGWYSNNYPRAVKRLGNRFPELATNRHARAVFTALVAVTSNGEKVNKNIDNAITLYSKLRSGKPLVAMGNRRATALENNLQVIQDLLAKHGTDFEKVLKQEITVKDMNAQLRAMGEEPDTSYLYNTVVPAAAVYFGPKLGAFYANLSGSEGYLTMDLWWTRSINRMRGLLIPRATDASIEKFRDMIGDPSMDRDDLVAATIPLRNKYEEFGYNTELEHLVGSKEPSKKGAKPAWFTKAERAAGPAYDQLLYDHNLEKMANTIYKNEFEGLEEAPFTANDRDFMYRAARRAQGILRGEGIDLTLADIQAALWYYEKRLYEKLSGRKADDIGYEEAIIAQSQKADRREGPSVVFPERDGRGDVARGEVADATEVRGEPAQTEPTEVTPPKFSISGPRLTPELRQAAQGSAIVDADGNLIPMYHGTAVDITTFRGKQAGAIFVTPDPEFASGFAKNSRKWMVRHPEQFISKPEVRQAVQKLRQAVYAEYGKQSRVTKQFMEEIGEVLDDAKETGAYNFKGELGDKWFDITSEMLPDGENVMPLYVLAKRPFDYENKADVNKIVKQLASDPEVRKELGSKPKPEGAPENFMLARMLEKTKDEYEADVRDKYRDDIANGKWEVIETPEVQRAIKALNFDSFWVMEGVKNLAVYDPRLIKSATGNVGTFGQRPPTEKEAARAGMEPEEALRAQEEGDIRFSLRSGRWTDKRVESLISSNMYTQNGREGDTKGYAAFIRPSDFLDATATRDYREQLEAEREPLRREELAKQSQPIMLTIRKDRPDRYEITGHEGRHRMMALRDAGIEEVPVYLELYGGGHEKSAKPISVYLSPQSFGSQGKAIAGIRNVDMTPLSWEYRDEVKQKFGGEGEVKFSLRSQVDPAITARMLQTTTARDKKDYEQRITEAIGPESRSRFRAAALNRYNRLGEADKLKLARMGGADLYADANAESAALLSDLASGIVAGALGVYDKIGGVPVYNRYYVVEKQVMGPQGMQFIPIGGKITSRQAAEALARRQGGEVKERGYVAVTNKDNTIKGPLAIFAPLAKYGDPDIYRYYQFWAGVKRGEKWMTNAQGQVVKERLFEQPDVQKAEQLRQQFLKEGIDFEKIQKEWTAYNDELVQFMLDTGVLSQKQADEYRKHGDYLPFYRQIQGDDDAVGPRIFQPISAVKQPRKLKGGEDPLGDFLENMVRNTQSAVQAGMKNIASRRAADVGMDVGMVDKVPAGAKPDPINSFYVLENGEKVYYDTKDALFIESIKSLGLPEFPGIGLLSGPANVLRNLVTKDPGFMLANMMRDSLSAWTTSGVNMMPIAATLKNFTDAIAGQSPEFRTLQMAGVIGGYDYSQGTREATEQFGKELRRTAGAQTAGEKAMRPFTYLWEGLEKGTQASDAATRIEVYKATLKETGNEAEALFRALEVMNFNRKGNNPIVRVATAAIPFLNARMQGLDVLYRAAFGKNATKNAAEIQKAFWVRGMTMAALSTMYWMLTHDEEEYKRQEQETRDNNWLFPSLGIRVPIPFEVGVLFKVVPERIAALTLGDDTAKDFTMSMGRNLANSLLANPIPQVALPLIESATNFSFFTLRPIVGQGLEGVAPAYQVGPGTSRLAEALGKATNLSPMKIDQILQGYTGTIGQYMSDLIDTVWDMHTDNPKASKRFEQLPVIKRFALDPDARGQVTAYFDLKNAADEATRTANLLERSMNYEEYGKYMTENIKMFAFKDYILDLDKTLKDYRDMKNMIRSLPMDADQKRDSIRAITQIENQMTTNIQLLKKQMQ